MQITSLGNPKRRLGKGEKKGKKQMATVSVNSCFIPKIRDKDSIIRSLMGSKLTQIKSEEKEDSPKKKNDNTWHKKIHRRAFLADQAKGVEYGLDAL